MTIASELLKLDATKTAIAAAIAAQGVTVGAVPFATYADLISARGVASLFDNGEQGVWFDPSDLSTLFQDSAGTIPVTAVEQPVGRILDKSGRGNHALQPTSANRPVLSARVNLLLNSAWNGGGSLPTGWTSSSATGTSVANGTIDRNTIYRFACAAARQIWAQVFTVAANQKYVSSVRVGSIYSGSSTVRDLTWFASGPAGHTTTWTLNGVVVSADTLATANSIVSCVLTTSATAGTIVLRVGLGCYSTPTADLDLSRPQFETGSVATTYQRVTTATDYDTVGFKRYLSFNGTAQAMSTAAINFSTTDKMMVCAGVRKLSDAAGVVVIESSANYSSNNGSFAFFAPSAPSGADYAFVSKGTVTAIADGGPTMPSPLTSVVTAIGNIAGDVASLNVNKSAYTTATTDQGTGTYGNHQLFIGSRAGTSLFFNGNIFGLIIRGASSSAQQISAAEYYMNGKTGAY